jgi:hypothetical protein
MGIESLVLETEPTPYSLIFLLASARPYQSRAIYLSKISNRRPAPVVPRHESQRRRTEETL